MRPEPADQPEHPATLTAPLPDIPAQDRPALTVVPDLDEEPEDESHLIRGYD